MVPSIAALRELQDFFLIMFLGFSFVGITWLAVYLLRRAIRRGYHKQTFEEWQKDQW
jgi:hypothetical protein